MEIGVTTARWVEPDPFKRTELIAQWGRLPAHARPDVASVNVHERGLATGLRRPRRGRDRRRARRLDHRRRRPAQAGRPARGHRPGARRGHGHRPGDRGRRGRAHPQGPRAGARADPAARRGGAAPGRCSSTPSATTSTPASASRTPSRARTAPGWPPATRSSCATRWARTSRRAWPSAAAPVRAPAGARSSGFWPVLRPERALSPASTRAPLSPRSSRRSRRGGSAAPAPRAGTRARPGARAPGRVRVAQRRGGELGVQAGPRVGHAVPAGRVEDGRAFAAGARSAWSPRSPGRPRSTRRGARAGPCRWPR